MGGGVVAVNVQELSDRGTLAAARDEEAAVLMDKLARGVACTPHSPPGILG